MFRLRKPKQPIPVMAPNAVPAFPVPPVSAQDDPAKAITLGLVAFFLFAVMNVAAKLLGETHHVAEVAFYRNAIAIIPFLVYIVGTKKFHLLRTKNPVGIFMRALGGSVGLIVTFMAFHRLPMADATALLFASTLLTPVLSHFLLKEHIGVHRWTAVFAGMCGVLVMAAPTGQVNMEGVVIALLASCIHAIMFIVLRYLRDENSVTVTFYFVLAGAIVPGMAMPFVATVPGWDEIWLFLVVGISGAIGQLCLSSAYRYGQASLITPFNYTGLIWATAFDILIWHYIPGWPVFTGGIIIAGSNLYIIYRERLAAKRRKAGH